jgi:hypothetical protein
MLSAVPSAALCLITSQTDVACHGKRLARSPKPGRQSAKGHKNERSEDRKPEHDALTTLVSQRSDQAFHMTSR